MIKKIGIGSLVALSALSSCKNQSSEKKQETPDVFRPNILWITAEDLSPRLGCYGDSVANTPVLDSLAAQGVRYTNAYSVSGVCAPSRAALITGMYPTSIGAQHMRTLRRTSSIDKVTDPQALAIPLYEAVPPPRVKCFTEYLRAAGYFCTNNSKTDYQFHPPITAWDSSADTAHWRLRPAGKPFFAVFNIGITHESQVWRRAGDTLTTKPENVIVPPYYPDTEIVRRDMARHYSNISLMDKQVGEILAQLQADGLADSTIVFFYGDHGDGLPRAKRWLFDSGLKVPLIIRFPKGEKGGTVAHELVSFVDFAPTILSLAGIEIPEYMQGQAFLGTQKANTPRKYIFAAKDRMDPAIDCQRAVRDKQFKFIKNYYPNRPYVQFLPYRDQMPLMQELLRLDKAGKLDSTQKIWFAKTKPIDELYDTEKDPHEVNNLADLPEYHDKVVEMRSALKSWLEMTTDPLTMPETELVEQMWGTQGQPQTQPVEFQTSGGNKISLSCPTTGASIAFQTAENWGTPRWSLYTKPLKTDSLRAVAIRIGYKQSEIKEFRAK